MINKRRKLLLREDEAKMIEYALTELLSYYKIIDNERKRNPIFRSTNIVPVESATAEIERILKLVQDAEVTETVVEL